MKYTGLIEVMVESDRERQKSAGKKQTFRRVSGGGEGGRGAPQLSLGRVSLGLLQRSVFPVKA